MPDGGNQVLYMVSDAGRRITIKTIPILHQTEKIVHMAEGVFLPGNLVAKKILVKGIDPIPRSEEEAVRVYIAAMKRVHADLEREQENILEQIAQAEEILKGIPPAAEGA
ncbi:hypothetical protein SAMN05444156_0196 [Verrucomicrobium sp. GAS474]|uniref:hypothetical protein n=1 Tax=Verrucomicrobium sp. GAS474 TaxID=1882831 RepID=UPI00087D233C|nr:hypothetical protein [Verrucomicrobium sp. GAS474]SDT86488.1 hypothetical protein SAMN05444156_0196 [Verrucomicrobium sp. GAS474]